VDELQEQAAVQRQAEFTWLRVQQVLYEEENALRGEYEMLAEQAKVSMLAVLLALLVRAHDLMNHSG
jgi:hypothetical protein